MFLDCYLFSGEDILNNVKNFQNIETLWIMIFRVDSPVDPTIPAFIYMYILFFFLSYCFCGDLVIID